MWRRYNWYGCEFWIMGNGGRREYEMKKKKTVWLRLVYMLAIKRIKEKDNTRGKEFKVNIYIYRIYGFSVNILNTLLIYYY